MIEQNGQNYQLLNDALKHIKSKIQQWITSLPSSNKTKLPFLL